MKKAVKKDVSASLALFDAAYNCTICGVDEVGKGSLAGPVAACAVIMPQGCVIKGVNDSKKLTPKQRGELCAEIRANAVSIGFGAVDAFEIDATGIDAATKKAMQMAVNALDTAPELVIVDGVRPPALPYPTEAVVQGDAKSFAVACASIVAKVTRDAFMVKADETYPGYGFAANKGYGTKAHFDAVALMGASDLHRKSFLRKFYEQQGKH